MLPVDRLIYIKMSPSELTVPESSRMPNVEEGLIQKD
jgi:hypothetical protein